MSRLPSGHGWAYLGVALGLTASVAGNVANTVLAESTVSLWLRVPFAVAWPVFLGIGIEVLTRIAWERGWKHWAARAILVGPMSLVSGFMSYLHLHHLMILSGEPGLAQAVGPLAVDGTLFGCTVALLVTRTKARHVEDAGQRMTLAQRVAAAKASATAVLDAAKAPAAVEPVLDVKAPLVLNGAGKSELTRTQVQDALDAGMTAVVLEDPKTAEVPVLEDPAPVSPAPAGTRTQRGTVDYAKVTRLVLEVPKDQDVAERLGTSPKTPQRVRRAVKLMDTTQDLDAIAATVKLSPAAVRTIHAELKELKG
jgi:hypothetical protein